MRSALFALFLLAAAPAFAQDAPLLATPDLRVAPSLDALDTDDLDAAEPTRERFLPEPSGFFGREGRRNPALAFGLSAAVPGLGQAYNGSWVRAAVAAGLEVGLIAGYVTWRGQGIDEQGLYQAFAHRDWSAARYATWLNGYPGYSGADLDVSVVDGVDFTNPAGWTAEQRARVDDLVGMIQEAERQTRYNNADGSGSGFVFSHVLPFFGEQQYYELIGKYFQYGPGWSDWDENLDPSTAAYYTIESQSQRAAFELKTPLFFAYAEDHAHANGLLRRASRAASVVVANHALSAFDALLTARLHNSRLTVDTGLRLRQDGLGGVQSVASVRLTF